MADVARALQTPVPATQPAPQQTIVTADDVAKNVMRDQKNERDRLRRKAKRAADLKAAQAAAAKPKKKRKAKKKVAAAPAPVRKKARGRGRPPGSKNKPKLGLAVALVPAPGVLPRAIPLATGSLLARIQALVAVLNELPEYARKVVLDAVK